MSIDLCLKISAFWKRVELSAGLIYPVAFFQELDIRELKKAVKAKSDELSEMQIRKDKAEKRLTDAVRDGDLVSGLTAFF